jgi:hypothetical protein
MLGGQSTVMWMSIAVVCCLIPGWLVVFFSRLPVLATDVAVMVFSMMIRLCSVASVAVIVRRVKPEVGIRDFFGWLIGFYLLALVVEVLLLRPRPPAGE